MKQIKKQVFDQIMIPLKKQVLDQIKIPVIYWNGEYMNNASRYVWEYVFERLLLYPNNNHLPLDPIANYFRNFEND